MEPFTRALPNPLQKKWDVQKHDPSNGKNGHLGDTSLHKKSVIICVNLWLNFFCGFFPRDF